MISNNPGFTVCWPALLKWEGFEITGWPVHTMLRGATIMKDGQPIGLPIGQHLERGVADVQ